MPTSPPGSAPVGPSGPPVTAGPPVRPVGNRTVRPLLRGLLVAGVSVSVFALCALVMTLVITETAGVRGAVLGLLAASTAIGIVVPVFLWVDRLEAEPLRWMLFAFLWGALVATLGAAVLNELGMAVFAGLQVDPLVAGAVLVAPAVEEALKALGVLVIFWVARREFNGVVDGIAYAGVTAAGFAFVENVLYLGSAYAELGGEGLAGVFLLRVLMSPFAHPMFTVCFGIALGFVAHRRSVWRLLLPLGGYLAAVALHTLWNFAAVSTAEGWLLVYLVVQVPLFVGFVTLLVWARRREGRMLRDHLTGYGLNGWFTPAEVAMLISPAERRRARRWARQQGGRRAARAMTSFQDEAVELAVARRHIERGDDNPVWPRREQQLLHALTGNRAGFAPGSAGGVGVGEQ
ncbi:PrsW family intramembrane metalloprotease [Ornithinicoccus halotolerans]|uniref:PrsW family intramembrane metalloprotease n=1 Tax=Ornithinicoccus halotolerans TaxID=1748220 RepID=UPI001295701C|nr:PrsW family intramembrane metalloprotease [Ornithinicoccus halotolerans]